MAAKNLIITQKAKSKKAKLLDEIRQGLKEAKEIHEGKARGYLMAELFDAK
jgi:hypothetical protein